MLSYHDAIQFIEENKLFEFLKLKEFILNNRTAMSLSDLSLLIELSNNNREKHSAYYTNDFIIEEIMELLPSFQDKDTISIIEPSVGAGNFLPFLFEKYKGKEQVNIKVIDIDKNIIDLLKLIYNENIPKNFNIEFICAYFIHKEFAPVDLVVGNPPFSKLKMIQKKDFITNYSDKVKNLSAFFLEKSIKISNYVSLVMPKNILNTPEYFEVRSMVRKKNICSIIDFGEEGFKGVLVETVNLVISNDNLYNDEVVIISKPKNITKKQKKDYIFDDNLPYWVIYRDHHFDNILKKLELGVFDVFRDRQITNSNSSFKKSTDSDIRVIKARNIDDTGENIVDIANYDSFINKNVLEKCAVSKYLNSDSVYLTPNMTYNPRVMKKKKGYVVNGSVAILIPKYNFELDTTQMLFFSSNEFRKFYKTARNYQTRSLNIDSSSCYWFGIYKG